MRVPGKWIDARRQPRATHLWTCFCMSVYSSMVYFFITHQVHSLPSPSLNHPSNPTASILLLHWPLRNCHSTYLVLPQPCPPHPLQHPSALIKGHLSPIIPKFRLPQRHLQLLKRSPTVLPFLLPVVHHARHIRQWLLQGR